MSTSRVSPVTVKAKSVLGRCPHILYPLQDKLGPFDPSVINRVSRPPHASSLSLASQREIFTCFSPSGKWGINGNRGAEGAPLSPALVKKRVWNADSNLHQHRPPPPPPHRCIHTHPWLWWRTLNVCLLLNAHMSTFDSRHLSLQMCHFKEH